MLFNKNEMSNFCSEPTLLIGFDEYSKELAYWLRCEAEFKDSCYIWIFKDGFKASYNFEEHYYKVHEGGEL
jgi:hypothetical protein